MMPVFEFTSPDGKTYEVEGPEGATEEQAFEMLQTQLGETEKPASAPASAPVKQSKFERAQSDFITGLKKLPKDAAALADMALSLPGQLIGVGADMGMRAVALGHGVDHRIAGIMAKKFREDIADPLSNPIEKLMHAFGYDQGYTDANVAQAMNKVGSWMEKGGEYVERQTGGLLTTEDVGSIGNAALAALGARGTHTALQARLDKLGKVGQETLPTLTEKQRAAETPPPPPAQKPIINAAKIDELLGIKPAAERAAAAKAKRAETRGAFADDPDLADYYAFKAEERAKQTGTTANAVDENFPQPKEKLPEVPSDTMIADAFGNVARTPEELAILRQPGTQEAIKRFVARRDQRGGIDPDAHKDMVKFLQDLGFPKPDELAKAMVASVDDAKAKVENNASGESAASLEAQSRLAQEKAKGQTRLLVERDGTVRPLVGVDAVDQVAKPGQVILQKGVGKDEWTTLSKGADVGGAAEARAKAMAGKQAGFADPKDLAKVAAVGTAAVVGSNLTEDPIFGGLTAAAFTAAGLYGGAKAKTLAGEAARGLDYVGGSISTRIGNMSQAVLHRAREYERGVLTRTHGLLDRAHPFIDRLSKVKGEKGQELARAILTNDPAAVKAALDAVGDAKLAAEFAAVRKMLDEVGVELQAHGRIGHLRENYFPRMVKDLDGLLMSLGSEARTRLQRRLNEANVEALRKTGAPLSDIEQTILINRELTSAADGMKGKPGFSKARQIAEVTKELQPFYASPVGSLHSYLSLAAKDLEKAKFFGKDLVKSDGKIDLQASIGNVVKRELDAGNITFGQAEELGSILRSRFGPGEASSAGLIQDVKNYINAGLLGNVVSAATQLGDIGTTVAIQGLRPTLEGVVRQLSRNRRVDMKDFGLADHISEEFVSTRKSAKFLNATFKLGLFSGVDRLGKNISLEAALSKLKDQTKTVGGMRALERKYGEAFGQDFPALVSELRAGKLGDQTRAALFSELSDMQPITRLEVPQAYLDMPNGRALYMLKTFMLKQFDIVRREGYNQIRQGNTAQGVKNLTRYAVALGVSGATTEQIRKWLMGQEIDFDENDLSKNILKTFGWSEYVADQARKGDVVKAVGGTLLPPYKMFDDVAKAAGVGEMSEAAREKARDKAVQYVPVVGKLFESHLLGGAERRDEAEAKRKAKEAP